MFRFADPLQFFWLLIVFGYVFLFFFYQKFSRHQQEKSYSLKNLRILTVSSSQGKKKLKIALRCLGFCFLVVALARPQSGQKAQDIKTEGIELMVAMDISNSMLAEDVRPNRLERAKKEVIGLLDQLSGDKVGFIAFAGSSIMLSPLTPDRSALKMLVEGIEPEAIQTQGTNFERVFTQTMEAFTQGSIEGEAQVSRVSKVLLLISDGENHDPDSFKKAEALAEKGIRIFTLAFGTAEGGKIPLKDQYGNVQGYLRDSSGQEVVSRVMGDALKKIAEIGKGSFYQVALGGTQMQQLKSDLSRIQKAEFDSTTMVNYEEQFQPFLLIGILLLLVDLFVTLKKQPGKKWRGRFEVAK